MSRPAYGSELTDQRFPRVSGDEPEFNAATSADAVFSPRERG